MMSMTCFLSGACGAFPDQGYQWRKILADAIWKASDGQVSCSWPFGLEGTRGDPEAINRLSELYDQNPYMFIRGDVDALLSADVVVSRLDGNEGVGTLGELAVARWANKPTVVSRKKPADKPQEHPMLPPHTHEMVNASPEDVARFVVRAVRAAALRRKALWK